MTRQPQNQSYDQKKGSAQERVVGQPEGLPGHTIADGEEPMDLLTDTNEEATAKESSAGKATVPEQKGCGPNVTDYPGLSDSEGENQRRKKS